MSDFASAKVRSAKQPSMNLLSVNACELFSTTVAIASSSRLADLIVNNNTPPKKPKNFGRAV